MLELAGGEEGGELIVNDYVHGAANQLWEFDEEMRLMSRTGYAVDIEGANDGNCARIIGWSPNDGDNQKWEVVGTRIESKMNGNVLDIYGGVDDGCDSGTAVVSGNHHGGENQIWNNVRRVLR